MGLFNRYQREGKGVTKEEVAAETPIKRFFVEYVHRFWQMIVLNMLYLLACAPIITIGPATAALNYVCRNFSQAKPVDFFSDFVEKCKEHFKQGFFASLIQILLAVALYFSFESWTSPASVFNAPSGWKTAAAVLIFFVAYLLVCSSFYLYPMMVSFDLSLRQLIRNSVILAMTQFWRNLVMIAVAVLLLGMSAAVFVGLPVLLPIPLFLAFSTMAYFNNSIVFPVLKKYVAAPEEETPPPDRPGSDSEE